MLKRLDQFAAIAFEHVFTTITRDEGDGLYRFGNPDEIASIAMRYAMAMEMAFAEASKPKPPSPPAGEQVHPIPIKKGLN